MLVQVGVDEEESGSDIGVGEDRMEDSDNELWGLDEWREFFKGANGSIFKVISNAITVAAKDHPEEFKLKRGEIVETAYSSFCSLHCYHHHNELSRESSFKDEPQGIKSRPNGNAVDLAHCKEAGCDVIRDDANMKTVPESKYSYSEAEALVEMIEREKEDIMGVLRIKEVLCNSQEESKAGLFESLRRLQLMDLIELILVDNGTIELVVELVEVVHTVLIEETGMVFVKEDLVVLYSSNDEWQGPSFFDDWQHSSSQQGWYGTSLIGTIMTLVKGIGGATVFKDDEWLELVRYAQSPHEDNDIKVFNSSSMEVGYLYSRVAVILSPLLDAHKIILEGEVANSKIECSSIICRLTLQIFYFISREQVALQESNSERQHAES
ncbi:unnamed protein product [Dovyalis caffra]|uniref:HIRAN domain-containing protein n=1 Tax=Dovyalis caffra TaxID=77055 RepID=A0AAV1RPU0_9ROSI|nr:unnamed protein product [Dovyalis caffra]